MTELWKPVYLLPTMEEFREEYEISNFGRLRTITGKISETSPNSNGYIHPGLYTKEGQKKSILLHRLVALAFCEGYQEGLVVNHLDENKANNHYMNLEWITQRENTNHGTCIERMAKSLSQPVEALDPETLDCVLVFKSAKHAAEFGFGHVSEACRGVYNKQNSHGGTNLHKGFIWRYA